MTFKDLFSERAALYSRYRPQYPPELFRWIAGLVSQHDVCWDSGTGNGQAAKGLARIFNSVIATDASSNQLAQAMPDPAIEYRVASASESGLRDASVNMVTVAQALHWFDLDAFYSEVKRVLRPDGALVVWGYSDPLMETAALEAIVHGYNRGTVEEYWMPERAMVLDGYANIPFPFNEVETPQLYLECRWTLPELAGYLRTWSATASYVKTHGTDPVEAVQTALEQHWGVTENRRLIRWPLHVRAGHVT